MLAVLAITFPFFALVLGGYLATRGGLLPQAAIPGLNSFVLYFALPAMLFRFGATTPILRDLSVGLLVVYLGCAFALVAFTIAVTLSRRTGWVDAAFGALVATFPNTGYMGIPLLIAILGEAAAGPAIATILLDLLFTSSLCIALSQLANAAEHGSAAAARSALRGVVVNPLPWAILLGVATYVSGLSLPEPVAQTIKLLSDAASPAALFTIGAVLARAQLAAGRPTSFGEVAPAVAVKLFAHPLLVLSVGLGAIDLGVPLDRYALTAIVLVAALPSASNVAMLAERFGADNGRIARIILWSTAAAFLTFSGAAALLVPAR